MRNCRRLWNIPAARTISPVRCGATLNTDRGTAGQTQAIDKIAGHPLSLVRSLSSLRASTLRSLLRAYTSAGTRTHLDHNPFLSRSPRLVMATSGIVPIIDFGPYLTGTGDERAKVAQELFEACTQVSRSRFVECGRSTSGAHRLCLANGRSAQPGRVPHAAQL